MYWLFMRPAVSWGAVLLIHAIGIPLVYAAGKACGRKEVVENLPPGMAQGKGD
ncbi:MAG TPA: hypothetical protein PKA10_06260 [Selenomonadales bacterium]|nr:hypothetical protein [Selenomonadales bacterium]